MKTTDSPEATTYYLRNNFPSMEKKADSYFNDLREHDEALAGYGDVKTLSRLVKESALITFRVHGDNRLEFQYGTRLVSGIAGWEQGTEESLKKMLKRLAKEANVDALAKHEELRTAITDKQGDLRLSRDPKHPKGWRKPWKLSDRLQDALDLITEATDL